MELKRLYSTSTIITICVIIATIQAASAAPAISVKPSYISVSQGDTFTVNVTIDPDGTGILGAEYKLYFNNILLKALSQDTGSFLSQGGASTIPIVNNIDNTAGRIEYGEVRTVTNDVGVTTPGTLATIGFEVRSSGSGELCLYDVILSDSDTQEISGVTVNNATVEIAQSQPSTPFLIRGYVSYEDESVCNDPAVDIANLNIGKEWAAETDASSNYYQITLSSCADIVAGETLQFNAMSPEKSQWNVTEHTVIQAEVDAGGFEYNITLDIHDVLIKSGYTGAHDTGIRIDNATTEGISLDQSLTIGDTYFIKYKVENNGTVDTETVDMTARVSNATWSEELANYQHDVGSWHLGNVTWDTTGLASGNYDITVNASIPMDCNPGDNERTREVTLGTAEPDTTPPTITNVANGTPTDSSVTITWDTDEASDSLVKYGTTSSTYADSEPTAAMVTSHSITLTGLSLDTTYYFVVNSTDASSNSNESEEHSFTTAAESINPPELISCVITPTPPVVQGTNISIDCLFSESLDYEIRIENATGALIEMISSGTTKDPDPKWWNTTTGTPAGTYIVNVTMDNSTSGLSSYNDTNTIEVTDTSDTTPPAVIGNSPTGTSVPVTADVTVTFDEAMNQTSAEDAFSILPDVDGAFSWSGNAMTFTPAADLADNTTYDITISIDAKDLAGNPLSGPFTWNFTTATVMPTSTTVSIENVTVAPEESVVVPIMVNYVTNLGACEINMTYNASVVHVTDVTPGDMTGGMYDSFEFNFDNGSGWMRANAANASEFGSNGNVVFAYVNLTAVASKGDTSPLDIMVDQLIDITYNSITHTVIDGTFTIEADTEPPLVTDASASRDTILNDNGRARASGTNVTVLNVTATDADSDVASVTIDLSSIGGSPVQPMEHITGTDVWTVTTNATDGVNLTHQLTINATDNEGNYNNTVAIELTVLRRGDVCRDNVIDGNDVMYIARYLAGLEPESSSPPTELVGDVVGISRSPEGDGIVDMMDVLYMARCEAGLEDEP